MELIPFLIFAFIAFNIFRGFTKTASKVNGPSAKEMMKQLNAQNRLAANYLKKEKAKRRASHKNPEQRGRRGRNVDKNRNRTDEWGQRGDGGLLGGRNLIILLVIGGIVLYVLSKMPAS